MPIIRTNRFALYRGQAARRWGVWNPDAGACAHQGSRGGLLQQFVQEPVAEMAGLQAGRLTSRRSISIKSAWVSWPAACLSCRMLIR